VESVTDRLPVSVSELSPYYKADQPCGALNQEIFSAGEKLITCSPISLFQDGNKLAKHATEEVDESSRDHSQTFSRHDCLVSLEKSGNKGWLLSASLLRLPFGLVNKLSCLLPAVTPIITTLRLNSNSNSE
ncbi:hypothetical protein C345_00608, partial [Cryptococcus neoformans A2-102-5]